MNLSFLRFIFLLICVYETFITFAASFSNNVTDHQALLFLKASITNDPSDALSSWNNSMHFCQWTGVTCNHRRQRVIVLNLDNKQLVGTLSPHIGNLSFLRRINLYQNNFHGSIPNEIGRLFRLQYLELAYNYFQGKFPSNLSHCGDIRMIAMYDNNLKGKLPTEFVSWSKLHMLELGHNHFTGSIPPSIGNISSFRHLGLGFNYLVGSIPLEIVHHTKFEHLEMEMNNLQGIVPLPLYNISSLYIVAFTDNGLQGMLPVDLGFTLPKLQVFYAGGNRLSGPLPASITNASNLVRFDIGSNKITGPVPMNLGSLPHLQLLDMENNQLVGNQWHNDLSFFNSLVNCTHLRILLLSSNALRGPLPNSIVNLSTTLQILDLSVNHIYRTIPRGIGGLVNLLELSLFDNFLTGTIPESIGELSKLGKLGLSNNNISGVIPASISNITQLSELYLDMNMLQGSIPTDLFNIRALQKLSLAINKLGGVIPEQIVICSQCAFVYLAQNRFTGPLPSKIGSLTNLIQLDVSYNKLTGDLPASLGDCVMLEELDMNANLFQGTIPYSFKALKSLAVLDLSNNSMSGSIPSFFEGFHLLVFLNLSHNKLGGELSKKGLFSNISAFSVRGNLELCGGIQALHLPACLKGSWSNKKTIARRIIVLLVIIVPLSILLACVGLICYRRSNFKKLNDPVPVLKDNQYLKLSYQDLLLATDEFSPNNILGEGRYGTVYKGNLDSVEQLTAVKVLNVEVRGAQKSFVAECETLRNVRHRNLIKIITACSSIDFKGNDFKALVFEFMINGSLDSWLHPSSSYQGYERNLSLLQRLNIAIDVALGVNYLHHHTHASIIHCDLKPSNILLDEDFVARIGDFGLARLCFAVTTSDKNQEQMTSTGVRGTIGYVPPEYGLGAEISAEGDVYSYGILLMEMFSGKRPAGSSVLLDNCNNLHDYVRNALPERVMNIVDPRSINHHEDYGLTRNQSDCKATLEACLESIFEVGLQCSVEIPRDRIDIGIAIKQLYVARDILLQRRQ